MEKDTQAEAVLKAHFSMREGRSNWDSYWQQLAEYFVPKKNNVYGSPIQGDVRENKLYTSISVQANEDLASALHGMLTNPSSVWFGLNTGDKEIDKNVEVKSWLQTCTNTMINVMNQSNFQTQIHEYYIDITSFGTAVLKVEEDDDTIVSFNSRPVYEGYVAENHKGIVDTVSYEYKVTLKQLYQEYGEELFEKSDRLKKMLTENDMHEVTVVHLVKPRTDYNPKLKSITNLPFASYKVLKEFELTLSEKGFHENPYVVGRWSKVSGETYGRSPAMKCLSDAKMVNKLMMYTLKGLSKVVDPPVQMPDDGILLPIKLGSGGVNYYRANSRDRIEPIITGARPDIGQQSVAEVEMRIKQAFYIDKLQVREADRQTATEVMQRREEQLRVLGPILGRQEFELLRPMVERVFGICARKGLFPPAPAMIQDRNLRVEYTSQIARAQKTADIDNITRVLQVVGPFAESKPELWDLIDIDYILRDVSDKYGLPAGYLLGEDIVEEIREARAEAMEKQAQMEQDSQEAQMVGQLGG